MSNDILREAAAEIRERAKAATPGPWGVGNGIHVATEVEQTGRGSFRYGWMIAEVEADDYRDYGGPFGDEEWSGSAEADAQHIASWHPDVARAVADLLVDLAVDHEDCVLDGTTADDAIAVARAYLGRDA